MNENQVRMMITGQVHLDGLDSSAVEVRRCMPVLSCDGRELGMVAAVCLEAHAQDIAAVLLGRLPVTADYRLIPIRLIDRVCADVVHLRITAESAERLAQHAAGAGSDPQE